MQDSPSKGASPLVTGKKHHTEGSTPSEDSITLNTL
jgi:hypothetical protein